MHVVFWLPPGMDDIQFARRALDVGLAVRPISPMYDAVRARIGLMPGFGGFMPERLRDAVARLAQIAQEAS